MLWPLSTDKPGCVIRPWSISDLESLVRYANSRRVWINMLDSFPHPYTFGDAHAWISQVSEQNPPAQLAIQWGNEAIGNIGLNLQPASSSPSRANMGYWLGEPFWGRGIATAVAQVFVPYAFRVFGVQQLNAYAFFWNKASMRVLEKAGFSREALLEKGIYKNGRLVDEVRYSLRNPIQCDPD